MIEFALGPDASAMGEHDVFGNRQPQSSSARLSGTRLVHSVKAFKQATKVRGGYAGSEVANVELDGMLRLPRAQKDAAARSTILKRIVDKVGENLMDRFTVSVDCAGCDLFDLQPNSLPAGQVLKTLLRFLEKFFRCHRSHFKTLLAGFHSCQGQ